MSVINRLKTVALELRKNRSPLGAVMQFHVAELEKIGKNKGNRETTEDEAVQYLKKAVQKLEENAGNPDEIVILEAFLPQMVGEDELRQFIAGLNETNKGLVLKAVREHYGARVDMKMASGLV